MLSYIVPVVPGTSLVHGCNPGDAWNLSLVIRAHMYHHQAPRTQHGFGREQRRMEVQITGLHRHRRPRNRWYFSGVRGAKLKAHTNTPTSEVRIILVNKPTLWAKALTIFSQAPAHRQPLHNGETSSLASLTRTSGSSLLERFE